MSFDDLVSDPEVRRNLTETGLVVVAVLVVRLVLVRLVQAARWPDDRARLRWLTRIRLSMVLLLVLGLVSVWATELHTLAISAVAIAAAVVLATKELIMCLSGSVVRYMGQSYEVGDRIEVAGQRGDVVAYGVLTTTLLEVGPANQKTGRAIVVPHSALLSGPVVNETFTGEYVLHGFTVPLAADDDWQRAEEILLAVADEVCSEHVETAERHMRQVAREHGLSPPGVEPRVALKLPEPGRVDLLVRVPTPAFEKSRTEQRIVRQFLVRFRGTGAAHAGA
jgi:small-conductance mechanosensitive channel